MKYTKLLSTGLLMSVSIGLAKADETFYGIGAAINDSLKIYAPITTDQYIIEPSLLIFSDHEKHTDNTATGNYDLDAIEIYIGFYKRNSVVENTYIYYGAKIGYIKVELKDEYGSSTSETKEDGYMFAPTIGTEYYLTNNFSLGVEISFQYENTDGTRTNTSLSSSNKTDVETTSYHTLADVIARYRF